MIQESVTLPLPLIFCWHCFQNFFHPTKAVLCKYIETDSPETELRISLPSITIPIQINILKKKKGYPDIATNQTHDSRTDLTATSLLFCGAV